MAGILRKLYFIFPNDTIYLKIIFRLEMGYPLNLGNPKTYNEKIQWLKIYDRNPIYIKMVDKAAVKDYVAGKIGKQYIIPTLGLWLQPSDIDWDSLPSQFVLKTTHGGGGGSVIICNDKNKLNKENAIKKLNKCLNADIYSKYREWPYKNVPKRIIAEKYMDPNKQMKALPFLADYKFFCFDGEPKFLYYSDSQNHKLAFMNIDWTIADFNRDDYKPLDELPEKPSNFDEMLNIARVLSNGIPHVRVDLYYWENRIYFGELTLYTGSGYVPFNPKKYDKILGDLLILPTISNEN